MICNLPEVSIWFLYLVETDQDVRKVQFGFLLTGPILSLAVEGEGDFSFSSWTLSWTNFAFECDSFSAFAQHKAR